MTICFQADADLNHIILLATVRRDPAIDFQSAMTAGLPYLSDEAALAMAARDGGIVVTHDRRTMPIHFAKFIVTETSPGQDRRSIWLSPFDEFYPEQSRRTQGRHGLVGLGTDPSVAPALGHDEGFRMTR